MKAHKALVAGLMFAATTALNAQDIAHYSTNVQKGEMDVRRPTLNFQRAQSNYLRCLNSETPGVVEAALGHVTLMRIKYPQKDMNDIRMKLYDLASEGATASIRQKAFTAMQVFANPTIYRGVISEGQTSGDGLLETVVAQY
ncbi:MAG TPA: hypothetical protein VMH23_17330 [Bacteroidota bacterium]|nr:hypothetical protein [Bacteroidota bacterium]